MGGSVGLTIRDPQGEVYRMCRWTNALPYYIVNLKLCEKDPQHLQEWLGEWEKMRKDWLDNRGDLQDGDDWHKIYDAKRPFEYQMTNAYAPYPYCAPNEYGIVVVDMMTNQIITSQGYTSFTSIAQIHFEYADYEDTPQDDRLKTLLEAGRFPTYLRYHKGLGDDDPEPQPLETRDWRELQEFIKSNKEEKQGYLYFPVDLSPFKVMDYGECDVAKQRKMKQHIESLIPLTDDEERIWAEWFTRFDEEEE